MEIEIIERVKNLYSVICNGELPDTPEAMNTRVNIIRELEKLTKYQFSSTSDFQSKISEILIRKESTNHGAPDAK